VVKVVEREEEITKDLRKGLKALRRPGRYAQTTGGYSFDRYLFRAFIAFFVITSIIAIIAHGGLFKQYAYFSCPADAQVSYCENPLLGKCKEPACLVEGLSRGESIGEQAPSFFGFYMFQFFLLACVFVINHIKNNGGKK